MTRSTSTRRRFLQSAAAGTGVVALAGCTDDGAAGDDDVPERIDDFLSDAQLYDGTIVDATDESTVVIAVGAGGAGLAFDPPAVRVDAGATVRWEWTGDGGAHNVSSADQSDDEFRSGDEVTSSTETFEQSFDAGTIQLYACEPHDMSGQRGGIEVVE